MGKWNFADIFLISLLFLFPVYGLISAVINYELDLIVLWCFAIGGIFFIASIYYMYYIEEKI